MTKYYSVNLLQLSAILWTSLFINANVNADGGHTLRGEYGISITESCVETPRVPPPAVGYDPATRSLVTDANAVTAVILGEMVFARDGSVTLQNGKISDLSIDKTQAGETPILTGATVTCEGTHDVAQRRRVSAELQCAAELPGGNINVSVGPLLLEGYVSRNKSSIILSSLQGNIHTETISVGTTPILARERICLLNGNLVRLAKSTESSDD